MKTDNIAVALLVAADPSHACREAITIAMMTLAVVEAEGTPDYFPALATLVARINGREERTS